MNNEVRFGFLLCITFWTTVVEELINVLNFPWIIYLTFVIDFHPAMKNREVLFVNIVLRLFVFDNISFVHKSFLANVTFVRSVFFMNHTNMSPKIILHPKCFWTLFTPVKRFSCMMRLDVCV